MEEYIPLIDQEYTESVGSTFRVRIFHAGERPEERLYLVEKYALDSGQLIEVVALHQFAPGQWFEPGAGESGQAREYGRLIEGHL